MRAEMIPRHTMKAVARQTGLSPHLIRMWERRYQAVVHDLSVTGRRLYSDEDIAKLSLLKQATAKGEAIGQVAQLSADELTHMMSRETGYRAAVPNARPALPAEDYLERSIKATRAFDSLELESILLDAFASMNQQTFLDKVLMPLLDRTGELWEQGDLKVSQEHLASAVVRSMLGSIAMTQSTDQQGPLMLTTTPSGQRHEFGALAAAVAAASMGWRSMYLGPDLPAEEIAAAARDKGARAVAISIVYPGDDPRLSMELRKLHRLLPSDAVLLAGGRASDGYRETLSEIGAVHISSLADFRRKLNDVRERRLP